MTKRIEHEYMIPMRDGKCMHLCVALPDVQGSFPTVLYQARSASMRALLSKRAQTFVKAGFAYAIRSVRGCGKSEGEALEDHQQGEDGYDTLSFLCTQPWSNGRIGTVGSSQLGEYQLHTALAAHPAHRAMCPQVPSYGSSNHRYGGVFLFPRTLINHARAKMVDYTQFDWLPYFYQLPVMDIMQALPFDIGSQRIAQYRKKIAEFSDEPMRANMTNEKHIAKFAHLNTPARIVTGWYDHCSVAALEFYGDVMQYGNEEQKKQMHLVIGPWDHDSTPSNIPDYDFTDHANIDHQADEIDFFKVHLLTTKSEKEYAPVRIFIMGKNQWRNEHTWPLARAKDTLFYLHGNGNIGGLAKRGRLSRDVPDHEPPDFYVYDPINPTPTWGGANCGPSRALPMRRGPRDQRVTLCRSDVLTYVSEPLEAPLEVTGPIKMILYAATSAKDTDFTVKLMDIAPSGDARLLCDGVIRARFAHELEKPHEITPDQPVRYVIDVWHTSNEFAIGHRIGVAISSSNFPRFPRNLNTGGDNVRDRQTVCAHQTIFHDALRPSHIVLPVVHPSNDTMFV